MTASFHVLSNSFTTTIKQFDAIERTLKMQQLNTGLHKSWGPGPKKNNFCNVVANTFSKIIVLYFSLSTKTRVILHATKRKRKVTVKVTGQ
jgi:hypothetical protein